ncbi:MAG: hypothetical protein ABI321_18415 [Polyangia bacterium]
MKYLALSLLLLGGCNLHRFFNDPRCYTSDDCDGGKICSAYLCIGKGTLGTGRKCWASRDCQDTQTCLLVPETDADAGTSGYAQRCEPAGSGIVGTTCTTSADCATGLRCDVVGFSGTCAEGGTIDYGGTCSSTADCLAGLACGQGASCLPYPIAYPPYAGVTCAAETGPFRAHFEVGTPRADFLRLPFPSDLRVDESGALDLSDFPRPGPMVVGVDLVALYADALTASFDGWSPIAPITFRWSAAVDASSLGGTSTLVDLTAALEAPGTGVVRSRATSYAAPTKYSCADRIVVEHEASNVLVEGHTYAAILRGVRSTTGTLGTADTDLATLLGVTRPSGTLGTAWDRHASLRTWLANTGLGDVQAATVFTVSSPTATLRKVAATIEASALPVLSDLTLCDAGVPSPCSDGGSVRVCGTAQPDYFEIQGHITMPIFQSGNAPYLTGGAVSSGVVRTEPVCFELLVPRNPMPVGGWPLVVYHPGTGGSFRSLITDGIAVPLVDGTPHIAAFSFDPIEHGARKNGSALAEDELVFDVVNPGSARGNPQQDAADVLTALRVAKLTLPSTITGSMVSFASRVAYFGHAQGGNAGVLGLAFEPVAKAAVLSGTGGGVVDGLLEKSAPVDTSRVLPLLFGESLDRTHPVMVLLQTYLDPSDPEVYAPLLIHQLPTGVPSKNVLFTFGLSDTYAPSRTLANVTKALGVPLVDPVLASIDDGWPAWPSTSRPIIADLEGQDGQSITAATFQYDAMGRYDGHFVALDDSQAIADWLAFLQTYFIVGTPHVP